MGTPAEYANVCHAGNTLSILSACFHKGNQMNTCRVFLWFCEILHVFSSYYQIIMNNWSNMWLVFIRFPLWKHADKIDSVFPA